MQFDTTYLTEKGRELATSTLGGKDKIVFTRAVASSHDYSDTSTDSLKALADLDGIEQTVDYSRITKETATTLTMRVDFPSKDVTKPYNLYTVGFYARPDNGDEVLYAVLPSSLPDYIAAYDGHSNINDSFITTTTVSDADNVLITVSQAGQLNEDDLEDILKSKHYATMQDLAPYAKTADLPDMSLYVLKTDLPDFATFATAKWVTAQIAAIPKPDMSQYYTKAEVDAKFVTDDDFASKLPKNIATTDAANTFAKSQTLAGGATDGKGNAYATTKDVATGLNNGLSTKVTDNKDGTEQLNGVQVRPYNKLSDTIGGRNLLINTAQLNDSTVCLDRQSNISDTYLGLNIYQTNGKFNGVKIYWSYLAPKIKTNTNYVMSEYVRNTSPTTSTDIRIYGVDTGVVFNSNTNYIVATLPPNSEWIRISALVNIDSFPATISGVLRFENTTTLTDGYVQFAGLKLEQGSVATDWTPAPEDKVNVSDMRKPASDVAGIEEVNAKQDKIGYTPANDSKVVHSTITQLNSTDMNTVRTAGFYKLNSGTNGMPNADAWTIYQVISLPGGSNGVQVAYGTNSAISGMRSWHYDIVRNTNIFTSWVQFADDSKVVHDNGNGTITVNGQTYTPANDAYAIKRNDAGNTVGTVKMPDGNLQSSVGDRFYPIKWFNSYDEAMTYSKAHPYVDCRW